MNDVNLRGKSERRKETMALLIANDNDRNLAKIVPGTAICSYCTQNLFYPYILTTDRNDSRYHVACAAKLAAEVTGVFAYYLQVKEKDDTLGIKTE